MSSSSPISFQHSDHEVRFLRLVGRVRWIVIAGISLIFLVQSAAAQSTKKPTFEDRTLITSDNVSLKITYFKSSIGKDAPVVVMLHGKRGTRLQWKGLATELQSKGDFAVITVDLRGHGESALAKKAEPKKADYLAMVNSDMDAVRDFVFEEHQKGNLNINKFGIVACDFSASVALAYAELDWERAPYDDSPSPDQRTPRGQDVQALALISPDSSTPGLLASKTAVAIRNLPIAVMVGASEKNAQDFAASKKLFEQISLNVKGERTMSLYFEKYPQDVRGMDLVIQDANVRAHIFAFLDKHLRQHQSAWRDRRSRLDRE